MGRSGSPQFAPPRAKSANVPAGLRSARFPRRAPSLATRSALRGDARTYRLVQRRRRFRAALRAWTPIPEAQDPALLLRSPRTPTRAFADTAFIPQDRAPPPPRPAFCLQAEPGGTSAWWPRSHH
ncbi:uncharacterized protein LOC144340588 isoform X2 [Macaca mulatta]